MGLKIESKGITLGIILFILGASAAAAEITVSTTLPPQQGLMRNTYYVGGSGPGNYTSIQNAINDALDNDIILVYPGVYSENQIIINKAVSIQARSGWETTIIDGNNAEISTTGLIRIIATGDVTFQGFTIRNAGGPSGYGSGDNKMNMGVVACSTVSNVAYTISENKIIGTQNPKDDYDWGFYAASGGKEDIVFSNNIVTETGCNNIVIEKTTGSTDICFNHLDAGCWGIDPIYYMTYGGVDITTPQMVRNNTIDVGTGTNPGGSANNKVTGIGFSSAYLGCTGTQDTGRYTNIVISGNTILNVKAWRRGIALDNFAWGDGVAGEIQNAEIKYNKINAVSNGATSFGIRLSGRVTNTLIQDNEITNCDMSFWGRAGYYGESTAYPLGTKIHSNGFQDNAQGFIWEGPAILNAENNWWGDRSGPDHPDNPSGTGDIVSGSVDFTPWLLFYGIDTNPPKISITSPAEGYININLLDLIVLQFKSVTTIAIGRIIVSVSASDNQSGIQRVEFYIDDELQRNVTSPPYEWRWNDRGFFFPYTLKVKAYDYAGNVKSDSMKVWKLA